MSERVEALVSLLDACQATPQMMARFDLLQAKLADRAPIAQLVGRRQFIEYKLKLASKLEGGGGGLSSSERAAFISELTDLQSNLDAFQRQYEKKYGEPFMQQQQQQGMVPPIADNNALHSNMRGVHNKQGNATSRK